VTKQKISSYVVAERSQVVYLKRPATSWPVRIREASWLAPRNCKCQCLMNNNSGSSPMAFGKVTKAVFPVAGLGSRFLPVTKASPKEMLPVVDKPLIQYP